MTWVLTTSGSAIAKAGTHANSTIIASGSALLLWCTEVEGSINAITQRTWVTSYSDLSTPIKNTLSDLASSMIAMRIIMYDPTGYLRREADMLMNMNHNIYTSTIAKLEKAKSNELQTP